MIAVLRAQLRRGAPPRPPAPLPRLRTSSVTTAARGAPHRLGGGAASARVDLSMGGGHNGPASRPQRPFGAVRRSLSAAPANSLDGLDLDDFGIPALDLTIMSSSVPPLPPSMVRGADDLDGGERIVTSLDGLAPCTPATTDAVNSVGFGGSFLSDGIAKMRGQIGGRGNGGTSDRARQRSAMRASNAATKEQREAFEANMGGRAASSSRSSSHRARRRAANASAKERRKAVEAVKSGGTVRELIDAVLASVGDRTDRSAVLAAMKESIALQMDRRFPRPAAPPPEITEAARLKQLSKLTTIIDKTEAAVLSLRGLSSEEEEERSLFKRLFSKTTVRRVLMQYGVTKNQWKRGLNQADLEHFQREFYKEHGLPAPRDDASSSAPASFGRAAPMTPPLTGVADVVTPPLAAAYPQSRGGQGAESAMFPRFDGDLVTTQADGTVLGRAGGTSVLCTVVLEESVATSFPHLSDNSVSESDVDNVQSEAQRGLLRAIRCADARCGATFVPLQVDYRERHHAVGKIPGNVRRRDNAGPLSDTEVLAARAVDRVIRPWLMTGMANSNGASLPENIVVNCEVQSYDPRPSAGDTLERTHTDPMALAINSAIAALYQSAYRGGPNSKSLPVPSEAVACVKLAVMRDGTIVFDPTPRESQICHLELLYAGTRDRVLMLEFGTNASGIPRGTDGSAAEDPGVDEGLVADAIRRAHEAIVPLITAQEELRDRYAMEAEHRALVMDEGLMSDDEVARLLGLEASATSSEAISDADAADDRIGEAILEEAVAFVGLRLGSAARTLFGQEGEDVPTVSNIGIAHVHKGALLSKKVRGRREHVLRSEISRLLREEFVPGNEAAATVYGAAIAGAPACVAALSDHVHERVMKGALGECAAGNVRADGRGGVKVVRPVSARAPVLPDAVHGSAIFARGETQVVCTATVGAPKEGLPVLGPYARPPDDHSAREEEASNDGDIPVGSLRFLRSQAAMESDMNTRRVMAGKEDTGDSGILSEVKRAFLHYDFPDFSTGVVKSKAGSSANRRAIGHGNLAEKAILPALPHPNDFPYAIRLTSEVTSSNGSSSMASACGSTLALLDAGVPLVAPVAGVSVGLAPGSEELLLDITGTEDHYGDMDFKICGTYGGITAMQLDVKRPVNLVTVANALDLARDGRRAILGAMRDECEHTLPGLRPRPSLKSTAPRIEIVRFDPNRKRDLIGPGGAVLRQLEDRFNVSLDLSQEGQCLVFGPLSSVSKAKAVIMDLVSDVEEGGVYEGTVIDIKDFGAVVELLRNKEGLLHVSEISDAEDGRHPGGSLGLVKEHLKVGDKIEVLCTKIDPVQGSIKLSRKKLLRMRKSTELDPIAPMSIEGEGSFSINGTPGSYQGHKGDYTSSLSSDAQQAGPGQVEKGIITSPEAVGSADLGGQVEGLTEWIVDDDDMDFGEIIDDMLDTDESDDEVIDVEATRPIRTYWPSDSDNGSDDDLKDILDNDNLEEGEIIRHYDDTDGGTDDGLDGSLGSNANVLSEEFFDADLHKLDPNTGDTVTEARWTQRFNELVDYKSVNGHTDVPAKGSEHPQLGNWVARQRQQFRKGALSDDRAKLLIDIGLDWEPLKTIEQVWEQRYNELKQLHVANGHCHASSSLDPQLSRWVNKQQEQYRKGRMTADRTKLLNDIEFPWESTAFDNAWEQHYDELMEYKRLNGDCNVIVNGPGLGGWVKRQRSQFKKGGMSDDRVKRLNDIGFAWSLV